MRVSLEWLAEFIDLPPLDQLAERLALGGFDDVEIHSSGPDLSALRVGRVVERMPHPNADRLSVCRVDIGADEAIEVVCGAPNVAADQKIAFAPVGARLAEGGALKRAKIRGVTSSGMICSARELGLGDDHAGILVLPDDAEVGRPLSEVIAAGERALEVTITPNRGDEASLIGLAREVRALFGGELRIPEAKPRETDPPAHEALRIEIEAPDDCHRYVARVVRGVRVGPSPPWLAAKLAASGVRAINNVVDVTNLVLLEFGQPLHAFDLAKLGGGVVKVRRAKTGEKLRSLDGESRELSAEDLVIADAERPIALAGVIGGANSEVGDATRDVLIESAHFQPTRVRLAARRHALSTEASYRFERGVDRLGIERAADRAAQLLAQLAGGAVAKGAVTAEGAPPTFTEEIRLPIRRANKLLGTSLARREISELLERVGVRCRETAEDELSCSIPSYRNDLHIQQDLVEEVARIHGYDRIPITEPVGVLRSSRPPPSWRIAERARDALVAAGLVECQTFPFASPDWLEALGLAADSPLRAGLRLVNPIRDDEPLLRTTLLPSLLRLVHQNRSRQLDRVDVFEVGPLFRAAVEAEGGGKGLRTERLGLAAVLTPGEERGLWEPPPAPLFFRAKGIAKKLLNQMGYVAWFPGEGVPPYLRPGAAAGIEVAGVAVGSLGELHPTVAGKFDLDVACAVIEVDLAGLLALPPRPVRYQEVSRQPRVRRDLAVVVDADQAAGDVLEAVRKTAGRDLVSAELFDRYEGRGVPEGRVSLAFRLVFQRSDRTLKDEEVTKAIDRVVRMLAHRFNGELR